MTLRAVVLDFYGTLTVTRTPAGSRAARAEQAAILGVDPDRFDAELGATVNERFTGAGGDVAGSLRWVCRRLGVEPDAPALQHAAVRRLELERAFGEPRPDAVDVLVALRRRGLSVGVISDCSAELPVYWRGLPIADHVDTAVFSFVTGYRKPAPEIYQQCCARLGVEPSECLYLGDGGSDELAGAVRVGMRAVHLAVPEESDGLVYGKHAAWDGESVTSLAAILNLVPAP